MSKTETIADLFPDDRHPTRELEPIQKVDRTDKIEQDIQEFYETDSAQAVLEATADIIKNDGLSHRFRYVHATFGSGKSHLLKLIGVATGEMEGLEPHAHNLAVKFDGFQRFRDALADSRIDHLHPLFMNLLDRDRSDTSLPLMLFEELGRRRGYYTDRSWLLEFCWRLDVEDGLWDVVSELTHEGLTLAEVIGRPSSLQPWLMQAIPGIEGASSAGLGDQEAVRERINETKAAVESGRFGADDLVDRLYKTKRYLEQDGDTHQFLIGLDEIAIFVGDQPRRYEEVVDTVTTLIETLDPPILGTGQWSMRDMQQDFIGDVDDDAWYAQEIELEGADTETIVRKRWLQKSDDGEEFINTGLLDGAPPLNPELNGAGSDRAYDDPAEAYPFRDADLHLLRASMRGLIEGDRETDREYIQGRALLVRVRHLFDEYGWAEREPGAIVPWDELYDALVDDTALVPSWAQDLVKRVQNTFGDEVTTRTAKALVLLSQIEDFPRTSENVARMLADHVTVNLDALADNVETALESLADENFIREDIEATPTTYTILSEEDIQFWREVQEEAANVPEHQLRSNIQQVIREVDTAGLTPPDVTQEQDFATVDDVSYTVRYTVDQSLPESAADRYDTIVVRLVADDAETLTTVRKEWQDRHEGRDGREDVLLTIELTRALREQVKQRIGMQSVLSSMADPRAEYQLDQQELQEDIEDELQDRLHTGKLYTPDRRQSYGEYLESFATVMASAVESKFPERRTIETALQLSDLEALEEFFNQGGPWPLTDGDADLMGINTLPKTIGDGWVTEFLEVFEDADDDRVSGERVLGTIENRTGAFLGTPEQALHALLFVLFADNRIAVRKDGERVSDTGEVARIITRRTQLEDAIIDFDPEPPAEGLADVYEALLDEEPDTDDTETLLSDLRDWVDANGSTIRTVVSRTNLEFNSEITLEHLENALEPAFAGESLNPDVLTTETVIEEAKLYGKLETLFADPADDTDPLWDQYDAAYSTVISLYPTATEAKQMQPYVTGQQIPTVETVENQLEAANELRRRKLTSLYQGLMNEEATVDSIDELRAAVTEALTTESVATTVDRVEDRYEALSLTTLRDRMEAAVEASEPLSESELADSDLHSDVQTMSDARTLLEETFEETPLLDRLSETQAALKDAEITSLITGQINRAVRGTDIPSPAAARQLVKQGEQHLESGGIDEGNELEQLWTQVADYEDGTIVVIDTEGNR